MDKICVILIAMKIIENCISIRIRNSLRLILVIGCLSFLIDPPSIAAQSVKIDSLESIVSSSIPLKAKKAALLILVEEYILESPLKALVYVDSLYQIVNPSEEPIIYARIRSSEAGARRFSGDFEEGIRLYRLNYDFYKSIKDSQNVAYSADNIGTMKMFQGEYEASQKFYHEALDIYIMKCS